MAGDGRFASGSAQTPVRPFPDLSVGSVCVCAWSAPEREARGCRCGAAATTAESRRLLITKRTHYSHFAFLCIFRKCFSPENLNSKFINRNILFLRVLKCFCCPAPTVLNIGNQKICLIDHPFVSAYDRISCRNIFQRQINYLVEITVVLVLQRLSQIWNDKTISDIIALPLRFFYTISRKPIKTAIAA